MSTKNLLQEKPELFDGYNGRELTPEQEKAEEAYKESIAASAPDYIKQAIAESQKQSQPA